MTRYSTTMSEVLSQIRGTASQVNEEKFAGWIAIFKGKKLEIKKNQASDLWGAKQLAIKTLKVPKSQQGLLAIEPAYEEFVKENDEPASPDEGSMATQQLEFIAYAADEIMQHINNGGEFPEWMQNKLSKVNGEIQSLHANINHENVQDQKEEVELEEKFGPMARQWQKGAKSVKVGKFELVKGTPGGVHTIKKDGKSIGSFFLDDNDLWVASIDGMRGQIVLDDIDDILNHLNKMHKEDVQEGKSSTGYELYHKDFSSAMQHAYDFAKKKFGIEVDPKEIDDKVASGPRKPSSGKTNTYRLKGKGGKGAIHVQVYNMDNKKYELNMYKEDVDISEGKYDKEAKTIATYAVKNGGIDKDDMMKVAAMLKKGDVKGAKKHTMSLDTDPRDWLLQHLPESVELEEKLKVSDGLGAWITDFHKSDAPQFAGKSKEERQKMAIAAFVDAGGKLEQKEETELDEMAVKVVVSGGQYAAKEVAALVKKHGGKEGFKGSSLSGYSVLFKDQKSADAFKKDVEKSNTISIKEEIDESRVRDQKSYKAGQDAAKKGVKYDDNPNTKGSQAYLDWSKGHNSARAKKLGMREEGEEPNKPDSAKEVEQGREDKKKTRIAQLQLQIAKATEMINKLNAQEK